MVAVATTTGSTFREHTSFRLEPKVLALIEDVARGVLETEGGLKSSGLAEIDGVCGISKADRRAMHEAELVSDEDECFDRIGEYLANGFSFSEVAGMVQLDPGATHLLTLERWCGLVRLKCDQDTSPPTWRSGSFHANRTKAWRLLRSMMDSPEGYTHAAVLHIVYGPADPFVRTLPEEVRVSFGKEFAPLARYTDVVEAKRQDLVREEASRGNVIDLAKRESADRIITSGDALRAAIAPVRFRHADEDEHEYKANVKVPAKEARDAFLTAVRIEANRMLTNASLAFHAAWQRRS